MTRLEMAEALLRRAYALWTGGPQATQTWLDLTDDVGDFLRSDEPASPSPPQREATGQKFEPYPEDRPPRRNGGTLCDMWVGPCACGAWHQGHWDVLEGPPKRLAKTCGHVAYRDHEDDCNDAECTHSAYQVVGREQCACHAETVIGGQVRCLLFEGHKSQPHRYKVGVELMKDKRAAPPPPPCTVCNGAGELSKVPGCGGQPFTCNACSGSGYLTPMSRP